MMSIPIPSGPFPPGFDIVFIEGLVVKTVIGIHDDELRDPQTIRINIAVGMPQNQAWLTDNIEDTIDYGAIRRAVLSLIAQQHFKLVESLAEAIAQLVLKDFGAHWVRIGVAKTTRHSDVEGIGIVIERTPRK